MTAFDAAAWYRQAKDAGDEPYIIIQRDGRETSQRKMIDIDWDTCPKWPTAEADHVALRHYLCTIGRYIDARSIAS